MNTTRIQKLFVCAALVGAATLVQAQFQYGDFTYSTFPHGFGKAVIITGYTGLGGDVTIPDTINAWPVIGIGNNAFQYASLNSLTIPASVTSIGNYAFEYCYCYSLSSLTIPASVTSIGEGAFVNCYGLTAITVDAANSFYSSVDGILFNKTQTALIQFPAGQSGSYTIPASVHFIGDYAFESCYGLSSVTIPASVASIGRYAFNYCTTLTAAYFLGNAPSDGGVVFAGDPVVVYYLPGATGWGPTFSGAPTVLWNPHATALRVIGGHFGFDIIGPSNTVIVVEACTNLAQPVWLPVSTNALDGSGASSFSDSQSGNCPARFYRFRSP